VIIHPILQQCRWGREKRIKNVWGVKLKRQIFRGDSWEEELCTPKGAMSMDDMKENGRNGVNTETRGRWNKTREKCS